MRKLFPILGYLTLAAWTLVGAAAWKLVGDGVQLTIQEREHSGGRAAEEFLLDRVKNLEADLQGLTRALETNLGLLNDSLLEDAHANARVQAADVLGIKASLSRLSEEHARLLQDASWSKTGSASSIQESMPESIAIEAPVVAPDLPAARLSPAKRSFLSFKLPSSDYAFDEERRWKLLPQLSRVGFDGSSTLHDFSAASSAIEGEFVVNPAKAHGPVRGLIRVVAHSLNSGLSDRDEAMAEHLLAATYEHIEFTPTNFQLESIETEAKRLSGRIEGSLRIRGVSRMVEMPLKLALDESGRLNIEGQMPLNLTDYAIPVPNKLGLVSMDDQVLVWISLSARCMPRGN